MKLLHVLERNRVEELAQVLEITPDIDTETPKLSAAAASLAISLATWTHASAPPGSRPNTYAEPEAWPQSSSW